MNSFVDLLFCRKDEDESSGDEVADADGFGLSHVGEAVHTVLGKHHNRHHHSMWNVTRGKVVGSVDYTPKNVWDTSEDPRKGNDDWFPEKLAEIISRTKAWCDIMSLGPPDGKFLTAFQTALQTLSERSKTSKNPVVVRILFGNIVGMPVNCNRLIKALTKNLCTDTKLQLWVGAWRKGVSWNHVKLIAVDGIYVHTGGHNLWTEPYLLKNPVHDLSIELEGKVARDAHRFANQQWKFIENKQSTWFGSVVDKVPDFLPLTSKTRVTVSEWPKKSAPIFPPNFTKRNVVRPQIINSSPAIPLISIGRQGALVSKSRPSDDAIIAMIDSSRKIIRFVQQDLGPHCLQGTKTVIPGFVWPKDYLTAMGNAMYERGVDIEIVLSNPDSTPGYYHNWDCVDIASEIIKSIQEHHSEVDDARLRAMVRENLRVCFIRHNKSSTYGDGTPIALHSKHFIVDDLCCYVGSQNLYICDLAEWGVVIDNEVEVRKIMDDYYLPMWRNSFTGEDVDVDKVMDGLKIDRDGEMSGRASRHQSVKTAQHTTHLSTGSTFYDLEKSDSDKKARKIPVSSKKGSGRTVATRKKNDKVLPQQMGFGMCGYRMYEV
ncbi:hypothetical protein ACHAWF_007601 [Thalassiosira exigua]